MSVHAVNEAVKEAVEGRKNTTTHITAQHASYTAHAHCTQHTAHSTAHRSHLSSAAGGDSAAHAVMESPPPPPLHPLRLVPQPRVVLSANMFA